MSDRIDSDDIVGGVTFRLDKYNFVREMVRIRDNHTCQQCGSVWTPGTKRFHVHHLDGKCGMILDGSKDKIEDMPKLTTLCFKCHPIHDERNNRRQLKVPVEQREIIKQMRADGHTPRTIADAIQFDYKTVRALVYKLSKAAN